MLHYFVKDFYAPVIASSYVEGDKFKLYVVSDLTKVRFCNLLSLFEGFSVECRKTKTKPISRREQHNEPIRTPSIYM